MAIGNKQIGWSNEANLLWDLSKKLERLIQVAGPTIGTTTTTTTSTSTSTTSTTTSTTTMSPIPVTVSLYATAPPAGQDGDLITDYIIKWVVTSSPTPPPLESQGSYINSAITSNFTCDLVSSTIDALVGQYLHIIYSDSFNNTYQFMSATEITTGAPTCPSAIPANCQSSILITQPNTCVSAVMTFSMC